MKDPKTSILYTDSKWYPFKPQIQNSSEWSDTLQTRKESMHAAGDSRGEAAPPHQLKSYLLSVGTGGTALRPWRLPAENQAHVASQCPPKKGWVASKEVPDLEARASGGPGGRWPWRLGCQAAVMSGGGKDGTVSGTCWSGGQPTGLPSPVPLRGWPWDLRHHKDLLDSGWGEFRQHHED